MVELIPDHLETLLELDAWLSTKIPSSRIIVTGGALRHWSAYLRDCGSTLEIAEPGNPILTLGNLTRRELTRHLRPPDSEMSTQPLWEKRRLALALGCPKACRLCSRWEDEGACGELRSVDGAMEEIEAKLQRFGIRDVEIIGSSWAEDRSWAQDFLKERIRRGLEIRLQLVLTAQQLTRSIASLLAPLGCNRLMVRAGLDVPSFEPGLTRSLEDVAGRGRIVLVCPARPPQESAASAAYRIAALSRILLAHSIHVLLHTDVDFPPACSETGRLTESGHLSFHLGATQQNDDQVGDWIRSFARSYAEAGRGANP